MSSSNVYVVKDIEDFNKILKHYKCVILKAGADWCVPCKTIEPLFDELTGSLSKNIGIVKINIDHAVEIKRKFKIRAVPFIANFFHEDITDIINTSNKEVMRNFINKTEDKYDMLKA